MRGGGWSSALVVLSSCVFTRRQIPCTTQGSRHGHECVRTVLVCGLLELLHVWEN